MAGPHVLIIGAGLGGTSLAQALRKRGIPFSLFERDTFEGARFQGWAISLHSWITSDLLESTKGDLPDLGTVGITAHLGVPSEGAILNGEDTSEIRRFSEGPGFQFIRADRAKLRSWLLTNIQIKWNKRFTHYEENEDGIQAFFEDGTSYKGDILVGADGISSRVRHQLLPYANTGTNRLNLGVIMGEVIAPEEQYRRWSEIAASFYVGVSDGRRIFVGLKSIADDQKSAQYYWMYTWSDQQASQESYWTAKASKEELHTFVMNHLEGLHPTLTEPIRETPVKGMLQPPLQMKDMVPPELPTGRVTLLGDAIHPMTPFQGEGGCQAMKDSMSLARFIEALPSNGKGVQNALEKYHNEMRPRAKESVLRSRAAT